MLLGTNNKAGLFVSGIHVGIKVKTGPPTSEILWKKIVTYNVSVT